MAEHKLVPPLSEEDVRRLQVRDTVRIDGVIFGIRDATLIRMFDKGVPAAVDFMGAICLHTAPNVKKVNDRYEKLCIGTTTSTRMDRFTRSLMGDHGVRAIIGKGGLLEGSVEAMQELGGCYLAIVGGAAALETTQIEEIEDVYWQDLMPECLWRFRVRDFGPLIVGIDAHGRSLYQDVKDEAKRRLPGIYESLGIR